MGNSNFRVALLLAITAAALYLPTLSYDFMAWDDQTYVSANPLIRFEGPGAIGGLFSTFYHANYAPLHLLSYAAIYGAVGNAPWAYHALNGLLHAVCTALVFVLLRRLSLSRSSAALGAALFLAHPVQVEVVAWVSQAKTALATGFGLASLLALLAFRDRRKAGEGAGWYATSVLLFVCAVLSKPQAIAFPGIFFCVERALGDRSRRLGIRHWTAFGLIAVAGAWVGILAQSSAEAVKPYGALGPLGSVLGSPGIVLSYLRNAFVPTDLSVLYEVTPVATPWDARLFAGCILIGALAVAAWRARNSSLQPWHVLGAFVAPLIPVLGWVPLNIPMADRYLYPAMFALAWFLGAAAQRLPGWGRRAIWLLPLFMALLALDRMPMWRDGASLWDAELRRHPGSFHAWINRSGYRFKSGDLPGSEADLREALALDAEDDEAWTNLGVVLNAAGRTDEAVEAWRRALTVNPEAAMARRTLGWELARRGEQAEARALIDGVIRDRPKFPMAYVVRAAWPATMPAPRRISRRPRG